MSDPLEALREENEALRRDRDGLRDRVNFEACQQDELRSERDTLREDLERERKVSGLRLDAIDALTVERDALREKNERPVPMVLHCPVCSVQHVDESDERTPGWTNPPHRSHLCHGCGYIWRPCDRATVGVASVQTKGKNDSPRAPSRASSLAAALDRLVIDANRILDVYPRESRGTYYEDLTRSVETARLALGNQAKEAPEELHRAGNAKDNTGCDV